MTGAVLRIARVHALAYRTPLLGGSLLVQVHGAAPTGAVVGLGEGQPGGDPQQAWECLTALCDRLTDREIPLAGRPRTVRAIAALTEELRDERFSGVLLGLEVALLDAAAQAHQMSVARLLGQRRRHVEVCAAADPDGSAEAVTIQPGQLGGLLPSLAAGRALDSGALACIEGPAGSDVTAWALHNLARAFPRTALLIAPVDTATRLSEPAFTIGPTAQELDGIGTRLRYERVLPYARHHHWSPRPAPIRDTSGQVANEHDVGRYEGLPTYALGNELIQREAIARGLSTRRIAPMLFTAADRHGASVSFYYSLSNQTSRVARALTSDKQTTRTLLARAGVPVPRGRVFGAKDVARAAAYAGSIGYPVVVKPVAGRSGVGVVTDIADDDGLRWAIGRLDETEHAGSSFVVEEHLPGRDYRIFVLGDEVVSVVLREPAAVTGDGTLPVGELVAQKIAARRRNVHLRTRPIMVDDVAELQLRRQGLTWDSVPRRGQRVVLALAANLSRGGDNTEVVGETHPSVLDAARRAVAAIPGLPQAGVDLIAPDHRQPLSAQRAAVCEVNFLAAHLANEATLFGPTVPLSAKLLTYHATAAGLELASPSDRVQVCAVARGLPDTTAYLPWLRERAMQLGVTGWARETSPGVVDGILSGPTDQVALLATRMLAGSEVGRPEAVLTEPAEPVVVGGEFTT